MSSGPFLYPNVVGAPGSSPLRPESRPIKPDSRPGEFDEVLGKTLGQSTDVDLRQVREPLKFSSHASKRMNERSIRLNPAQMAKVHDAVDKAAAKGIEETLVITGDAAFIVSVKNKTVITAMDRESMSGNVFTNIDGAVIV